MVGASKNPEKASNEVADHPKEQGYRIIPVNPKEEKVLGERVYATVQDISEEVDVFLASEKTPEVARDAVEVGAKVLRLQESIKSEESRRIAEDSGLIFVEDRRMKQTHEEM